jgi:hypothetical protein
MIQKVVVTQIINCDHDMMFMSYLAILTVIVFILTCTPLSTAKESQIPAHVDSRKKGDIMEQCQLGRFQDLILDFSLTHPRYGASKLHLAGQWKLHGLHSVTRSKDYRDKHAISEATNKAIMPNCP